MPELHRNIDSPPTNTGHASGFQRLPSRRKLRYLLLAGLIVLQVVTVAGILLSQHIEGRQALRTHIQALMAGVIGETKENAQGFLGAAQNAVVISRGLFSSGLLSISRPQELEHYFLQQLDTIPQMDGVYYGDPQGQFVYVMRTRSPERGVYHTKLISIESGARRTVRILRDEQFREISRREDPDDVYDPRTRPWYAKAIGEKRVVWTDPYVFFTSRQPGITSAAAVFDGDDIRGVVGVDIEISALSHFLARQAVGDQGSAFVVDRDGRIVAHPRTRLIKPSVTDDQLRLMRFDEVEDPIDATAMRLLFHNGALDAGAAPGFRSFHHRGALYHAVFEPFSRDPERTWVIGVYAADSDFLGPLRSSHRQSTLMAVVIGAGITLLAFLLAQRFVAPVAALEEEASRDDLTRLLNRRRLFQLGPDLVREAVEKQQPLCSLMFDIDQFKEINDAHGHSVGDEVLMAVIKRVKSVIAEADLLARYGGDEFKLFLPNASLETGLAVAERLRLVVCESPFETSAGAVPVTISIGVAALDPGRPDFGTILKTVDRALLDAKRLGRNRVSVRVHSAVERPTDSVLH